MYQILNFEVKGDRKIQAKWASAVMSVLGQIKYSFLASVQSSQLVFIFM